MINKIKETGREIEDADREVVIKLSNSISRNIKRKHKIEEGEKYTIKIEALKIIIEHIIKTINRHVRDPEIRSRIARDLNEGFQIF